MIASMHRLTFILFQSSGLRHSIITVAGNTLATCLSAVALIFISRSLGPTAFGQFSVGFAILVIMSRINDVGINAALLKFMGGESNQTEIQKLFAYSIRLKIFVSLAFVTLGLLLTPLLVTILKIDEPWILALAFVLSLVTTTYEHLLSVLQALHRFNQAVAINAIQSATKLLGALILSIAGFTQTLPFFIWYMLAPLAPVLFLSGLLPKWLRINLKEITQTQRNKAFLGMARHAAVGFIAAGLIENLDVLFVQSFLSSYETGLLAGVSRIAMMFSLVAYSLGNVLYPRVARYKTREHLRPYLKKSLFIAVGSVLAFFMFLPFSRLSIFLTVGPEYVPGTHILIILLAAAFLTITTVPFLALFYSFKADWYFSVSGIMQLLVIVGGNLLLVPSFGLEAAAWTRLVARVVLLVFTVLTAWWFYVHKVKE